MCFYDVLSRSTLCIYELTGGITRYIYIYVCAKPLHILLLFRFMFVYTHLWCCLCVTLNLNPKSFLVYGIFRALYVNNHPKSNAYIRGGQIAVNIPLYNTGVWRGIHSLFVIKYMLAYARLTNKSMHKYSLSMRGAYIPFCCCCKEIRLLT